MAKSVSLQRSRMQLSVIIVNYNVRLFLEQSLCSVQKAVAGMQAEIILIDNNSTDGSLDYLQPRFPAVRFIANTVNVGFGKACNQGLKEAKGEYILFLNPDTIVAEDCFEKCISFFIAHPDAGAVGVKMLDGSGEFLKESKRSFPSPATSLYKLSGLSKLFPTSRTFSNYHLGHLDENKEHEVDVLAGAFMMIRKEVLDKTGGFDEVFFMYGEDVDLSYRIQKAGYKNYYFPGTEIIHFKGESTKKGSMNYVRMFYNAMSIFVRKHYGGNKAGVFNFFIHLAIWLRAMMTAIGSFIRRIGLPLLDAGLILLSFWLAKIGWNYYVRPEVEYSNQLLWTSLPAFTVFYLVTAYYAGLYDRWHQRTGVLRSTVIATIVLLAAYALLPEHYRFSRGILVVGAFLAFILISTLRWILIRTGVLARQNEKKQNASTLVAGTVNDFENVQQIMSDAGLGETILGRVAVQPSDTAAITTIDKLPQLSATLSFREIIFCEGALSFKKIIDTIKTLPGKVSIKLHAANSHSIVGSDSKDSAGEAVAKDNSFRLNDPYNKRMKRLVDVMSAISGIVLFPVHLFLIKNPFHFLGRCMAIIAGKMTWVGYATTEQKLPKLRKAVIGSNGVPLSSAQLLPLESRAMMDYWYARDYEPLTDLQLLRRNYRRLGD